MESNPMLDEVWPVKDQWARVADDNVYRLCQNTCQWAAEHSHPSLVLHGSEELRRQPFPDAPIKGSLT